MACYSPNIAYQHLTIKQKLKFLGRKAWTPDVSTPDHVQYKKFKDWKRLSIPCGQCVGCRLEKSRQWALRAYHEASLYEANCFLTLTYNPENLPQNGSIDPDAPVLFMKRLRKAFGANIRSFGCAEYGEKGGRPHYHICVFNFSFKDKVLWKEHNGQKYYTSEKLSEIWPYGYAVIGDVTFESAAYVARYCMKKINGKKAAETYGNKLPERAVCISRRPGLGRAWFDKFKSDVYPSDTVVVRGREMRPPKYYDRVYELENPDAYGKIKLERELQSAKNLGNRTRDRSRAGETIKKIKASMLKRGYESN